MRHLALWTVLLVACGDDTQAPETPVEPGLAEPGVAEPGVAEPGVAEPGVAEPGVDPAPDDDPLEGLDDLAQLEAEAPDGPGAATPPSDIPEGGCAPYDAVPLRVWPRPGIADVVAVGEDGFAIAGYANGEDGEEVFLATARPGRPARPVMRETLERPLNMPRVAPPGLAAVDDGHVAVAITDLGARVLFDVVQLGGERRGFVSLASGVDQRFQPAVGVFGSTRLVAYTDGTGERTTAWLLSVDSHNSLINRRDLTVTNGTGRAPIVTGQGIVFIDAREGTSTVWLQPLDGGGAPRGETSVLTPLANVYDPVQLALADVPGGQVIAYTAVGRGAKTAVGLVTTVTSGEPPVPIVPSEGYGALSVDVVTSDASVVYVADAPKAEPRDAPRELRVRRASRATPTELGDVLTLRGPDGTAHHGRIARHGDDYAVVFGSGDGVYLHWMRCDEGR